LINASAITRALLLAARQADTSLLNFRLIAHGRSLNDLMDIGDLTNLAQFPQG
jgi:hypothetical protein